MRSHAILPSRFAKSLGFAPIPVHATFQLRHRPRHTTVFEHYSGLPTCAAIMNLSSAKMVKKICVQNLLTQQGKNEKKQIFQYVLKMLHLFSCPVPVQMSCLGTGSLAAWLMRTVCFTGQVIHISFQCFVEAHSVGGNNFFDFQVHNHQSLDQEGKM